MWNLSNHYVDFDRIFDTEFFNKFSFQLCPFSPLLHSYSINKLQNQSLSLMTSLQILMMPVTRMITSDPRVIITLTVTQTRVVTH